MKRLEFRPAAADDLRKLDPQVARQVLAALRRYAETGRGDVKKLKASQPPLHRLRAGDWRARFILSPDTVTVVRIQHRSEAYR